MTPCAVTPVIIIFGAAIRPNGAPSGALRKRIDAALATGRRLDDPLYMPTGGQGRFGPPEAQVMADHLVAAGVDPARIRPEQTGRNTIRSAIACAALLGRTRAPIYVATSRYHLVRCVVLLRLAGLRARPGIVPAGPASRRWPQRWYWRLREVPAVPVDVAVMLFSQLRMNWPNRRIGSTRAE